MVIHVPPPSVFVKVMNVTIGGAALMGLGGAAAGTAYRYSKYVEAKPPSGPEVEDAEKKEGEEEAAGGDTEEDFDKEAAAAKKEKEEDEEHMKWVMRSMFIGGAGWLLACPFALHLNPNMITWQGACHAISWHEAFKATGMALGFLTPFPIAYFVVGEDYIVKNVPKCLFAIVMANTLISLSIFPLEYMHLAGGLRKHQTEILYYLTGMRIGVMGAGACLVFLFANRYARVQLRKVLTKCGIPFRDNLLAQVNYWVILGGCMMGNATAGVWVWIAYTDWAGAAPNPTLFMIPLTYVVSITMHLKAPSTDHDQDDSMSMMREGFMGFNSVVLVPNPIDPMMVGLQRLIHFAMMACWYGTLQNEFSLCHTAESLKAAKEARVHAEENPLVGAVSQADEKLGLSEEDGKTAVSQDPSAAPEE